MQVLVARDGFQILLNIRGRIVSADRVDGYFCRLRRIDCCFQISLAGIVLTIRQQNQYAGYHVAFRPLPQLLASHPDCIVHCRSTIRLQPLYALRQEGRIIREVLRDRRMIIEAHHKSQVAAAVHCLPQKQARRRLLETEASIHGAAGVDQYAYTQRQILFSSEAQHCRRCHR